MKQASSPRSNRRRAQLAGFVFALPWLTLVCSHVCAQDISTPQEQPTHHAFIPFSTAKALPMRGAVRASAHAFETEDGILVVQSDDWYKTADNADAGLDGLVKNASRVINRGTKIDAKGSVVGRRVELALNRDHGAKEEMVIAWTDGADLVRLRSTSLPLLLDFENQYYPGSPGPPTANQPGKTPLKR